MRYKTNICKVCNKKYSTHVKSRKGRIYKLDPKIRPFNSVTCSSECSKLNIRKNRYIKVDERKMKEKWKDKEYKLLMKKFENFMKKDEIGKIVNNEIETCLKRIFLEGFEVCFELYVTGKAYPKLKEMSKKSKSYLTAKEAIKRLRN